jgi:hypothetical protein
VVGQESLTRFDKGKVKNKKSNRRKKPFKRRDNQTNT